jgi:hypothetical protein
MIATGAVTLPLNRMPDGRLRNRNAVSYALHACGHSEYDFLLVPKLSTAAASANVETSVRGQQQS